MEKRQLLKILKSSPQEFYSEHFPQAVRVRFKKFGNNLETCAILNAKSGRCNGDCKFCSQSRLSRAKISVYPLLDEEELVEKALKAFKLGVERFSFVTSGVGATDEEIKRIGRAIKRIKEINPSARLCASLGQMDREKLLYLKECGLDRYHHNLETSREFYPKISSQSWEDRYKTVEAAKEAGLETCSGGIFGLGESDEDVISLALSLKELGVNSVAVNFLNPIEGTPLERANYLTPLKCLKVLAVMRLALPDAQIRVCGGREKNLGELQPLALLIVDSLMVGNYLTTKGRNLKDDARLIESLGLRSYINALSS